MGSGPTILRLARGTSALDLEVNSVGPSAAARLAEAFERLLER